MINEIEIKEIETKWKTDQPNFETLGQLVSKFIQDSITEHEILPDVSFRTKELLSIVKKIQRKRRDKEYSYDKLTDKLGIRIICTFQEDMRIIHNFLDKNFNIINTEYKQEGLDFNKLDYISNHYDIKLCLDKGSDFNNHPNINQIKDLVFEVQVRTLNQHTWANAAHSLTYKGNNNISPKAQRKIYRLLSLYELADDEFSSVNKLVKDPKNLVYFYLDKLERKIFRYAKMNYDRDISIDTISKILSFISEKNKTKLKKDLDKFIEDNHMKFEVIFKENKIRFYEIPTLTQPEIFIIWYGLVHFRFAFTAGWEENFPSEELIKLAIVFGLSLD